MLITFIRIKSKKKIISKQKKTGPGYEFGFRHEKKHIINLKLRTFCTYYLYTVYPRSLDPFYIVSNYTKWLRLLGHTIIVFPSRL